MRITRSTLRRIIAEESARILAETKKKDSHERIPGGHQARIEAGFDEEPEEEDWDDYDYDDDEDDYTYGDDPDEFADLPAGEIQRRWRDLDEGEGKKHHTSPRKRLEAFLNHYGVDVDAVMAAVDSAVSRGNDEGLEVSSEDIAFNLPNDVLESIPEDESDIWHALLDGILNDEVDPDAFADAEAYRRDIEDTERDLSHPSRFLEASHSRPSKKGGAANCLYILYGGRGVYYYIARGGLSEDQATEMGEDVTAELAGDQGSADPLSLYDWLQNHDEVVYVFDDESIGGFAEKEEFMMQLRDVGEEEGLFASDDDEFVNEGDDSNWDDDLHAQSEYQHALDVGPEVAYADYDTGGRNAFTQRGLKGRGPAPRISGADSDSGEDVMGGGGSAMADYEHAWNIGGGSDEEGFAADYDTGGRNKFTKMGMRGRSGLSEARWAKLAGILEG